MEKLNSELVLDKTNELVSLIKESNDYKRYLFLKEEMKKDKQLMELVNKIKKSEKLRVNLEHKKEDIYNIEKEINSLRKELNEYPIYQEYLYLQEDLNNLFQNIRNILETNIN